MLHFAAVNETVDGLIIINRLNFKRPGLAFEINKLLCESLKADCQFVIANHSNWFTFTNEAWGGLLGEIYSGCYSATMPIWLKSSFREKYFGFSEAAVSIPYYFTTRRFDVQSEVATSAFHGPLNWRVWLLLLLTLTGVSAIIWLKLRVLQRTYRNFLDVVIVIFGFLIRKGTNWNIGVFSIRVFLLLWGFISLLLTATYTGGLLSAMFKVHKKPPFTDFSSLLVCLKEFRCQMVFSEFDMWFERLFDDSTSKYFDLGVILKKNPPLRVKSTAESFKLIRTTPNIFLVSGHFTLRELKGAVKEIDSLYLVRDMRYYHFVTQKNQTDLLKRINSKIVVLYQSGVGFHLLTKYFKDDNNINLMGKAEAPPLSLRIGLAAVIIMLAGQVISLFVLIYEIFSDKVKKIGCGKISYWSVICVDCKEVSICY